MKGIATRYIVLFVLGMVSLMVALSLFFGFGNFFSSLGCRLYSLRNVVFRENDPIAMEKCMQQKHDMEQGFVYGEDCHEISEGIAPYMIACWERSYQGRAGEDIWCYELSVSNKGTDCSSSVIAGELTRILSSTGQTALNDNSAVTISIPAGETLAYVVFNSTSGRVEII